MMKGKDHPERPPQAAHNVDHPPDRRFHLPETGGRYAPRTISIAQKGSDSRAAWLAFSAESSREELVCDDGMGNSGIVSSGDRFSAPPVMVGTQCGWISLWTVEDGRLFFAEEDSGEGGRPIHRSDGWLRDICGSSFEDRVVVGVVESRRENDSLLLFCNRGREGFKALPVVPIGSGRVFRPSLVVNGDGIFVAYEHLETRRTVVVRRLGEGTWEDELLVSEPGEALLLPRLAADTGGRLWMTFLADRVVERSGVVSHACTIRGLHRQGSVWSSVLRKGDPDLVHLYRGLLPERRYFGYSGLRRNPQPLVLRDGRVFVCWEAQRSEEEDWFNLENGEFLAFPLDGSEAKPRLLAERGACFQFDFQAIHEADRLRYWFKGEHRQDGGDFRLATVNLDTAACREPDPIEAWSGWKPFGPVVAGDRFQSSKEPGFKAYFGDFHNHSIHSPDAEGFPDELYGFARQTAALDFSGITDNDFYPNKAFLPSESLYQRRLAELLEQPGRFLAFTGFEWTFHRPDAAESYNHRSVVFHPGETRILRRIEPSAATEEAFGSHAASLNAFAHAHHGQFSLLGLRQEANVEVTSGWGINIENSPVIREHLNAGKRFGFIGGSDSHRSVPGLGGALVAVWAESLTYEALIGALEARRCYATTGNRILVEFRLNGAWMGEEVRLGGPAEFFVRVIAGTSLKRVSLIGSGGVVHEFPTDGNELKADWTMPDSLKKAGWYYLRVEEEVPYCAHPHNVCQAVGPLAWSSPIWMVC